MNASLNSRSFAVSQKKGWGQQQRLMVTVDVFIIWETLALFLQWTETLGNNWDAMNRSTELIYCRNRWPSSGLHDQMVRGGAGLVPRWYLKGQQKISIPLTSACWMSLAHSTSFLSFFIQVINFPSLVFITLIMVPPRRVLRREVTNISGSGSQSEANYKHVYNLSLI